MSNIQAWLDAENIVRVDLTGQQSRPSSDPVIKKGEGVIPVKSLTWNNDTATIKLEQNAPIESSISINWQGLEMPIYPRGVVRTATFEEMYDASGEKLGCIYTPEETSFSVWAPTATKLVLVLEGQQYEMTKESRGVWTTTVFGDYHLARYHFLVTVNGQQQKVNDPYAKSLTPNSEEGVVLDLGRTDPVDYRSVTYPEVNREDAVIYELHIRDATISKANGVKHKGKFLGLTERNTKSPDGYSTALSYISQLGITHVQLLPVQDYARVNDLDPNSGYNWGYDPLFFFSPEGSYATDVNNPVTRVNECKKMIKAFHEEELSVILDVVYNHVFERENSAFEKLVPGYYFRYRTNGEVSDATGTGNDLATERKMVRKFILDCVDYWLTEYHVDGFRFDLMGVIDLETMQAIRDRCEQEDRPILLLGEGWDLDTPLPAEQKATNAQSDQLSGVSFFNDRFRDSLKGHLFDQHAKGFANGNGYYVERLPQLVAGSTQNRFGDKMFSDPLQSVNYVECHDNHTLWDRLLLSNPEATDLERKQMHQLATGLTLLSQGIPFLHAGQEFFRTKNGDENSYISGDAINQLEWERRGSEDQNVQWIRQLLELRKQYRLLRLGSTKEIEHRLHIISTPNPVFGFMLAGEREDLVVFANPTHKTVPIRLPAHGIWIKLLSNHSGAITPISCPLQMETEVASYELAIFKKQRK
ncbi:type I pullulanase [Paraliobacillus quinghaiensis]|uniref:Type I pullulanase n=1 Tax=Paraliobacillus quinghaiensis TaxID=470815 RepID=A0A917WPE8_9BACI|nr:type I pullulanase [Paraliobacillus quinghaiensis]GGM19084.1 type I pullulanase [Paraliobacillus quinghaiensis]